MSGRYLHEGDIENRKKYAVIGRLVAQDLFDGKDPIGEYIFGSDHSWRVIGVFQDEGGDREERTAYVPYTAMQEIQKNSDKINQMIVIYNAEMTYDESLLLEKKLEMYIKNKKVISPDDNRGVYISNTGEQLEEQ